MSDYNDYGDPPEHEPGDAELIELRLREALYVEPIALEEEFVRMGADIAYWSARHAEAIGQHLRAKAFVKRLRGFVMLEKRAELFAALPAPGSPEAKKKGRSSGVTESQVEALADNDARVVAAQEAEIDAEVERERLKGGVAALLAKRDMIVQLGSNRRAELARDPVVRENLKAGRFRADGSL